MKNPASLSGKTVMITGAAHGIGRALAAQCLAMGAKVSLVDIDAAGLDAAARKLNRGDVVTFAGDITDPAFVNEVVSRTLAHHGSLHGLINNAGIVRAAMAVDMPLDQWQQVLDVNLTGAFICLQAVGRHLIEKAEAGDANPGSIVNIASDAARRGTIGQINYGAAKAGILGLTMCSAREWARYNINVNSICYGLVETAMTETIRQDKFRDKYLNQIPLRRFSSPEEVAPATCFFLSDATSYITGQHISIDGGFHISS